MKRALKMEEWMICGGISIFLLIGGLIMIPGVRNVRRAIASSNWPTTPAVVQSADVAESRSRDTQGRTTSISHSATIKFAYEVNGRAYTTDRIQFGQIEGSGDSSDAELRRLRYPPGAKVTVSYDPRDPSIAAAIPGFHADAIWLPGAGLAFFIPGLMAILIYLEAVEVLPERGYGWMIFAGIFCAIGLAMLIPGLQDLRRARASENWPEGKGKILYSKQDESVSVNKDEDGNTYRSTSYGGRIIYRYEIGGKTFFSNTRRFGQLSGADEEWAQEILARYPLGEDVPVFYNPSDPQMAALEPGIAGEAFWLPGAGLSFLLFGIATFFIVPRRKRRKLARAAAA